MGGDQRRKTMMVKKDDDPARIKAENVNVSQQLTRNRGNVVQQIYNTCESGVNASPCA